MGTKESSRCSRQGDGQWAGTRHIRPAHCQKPEKRVFVNSQRLATMFLKELYIYPKGRERERERDLSVGLFPEKPVAASPDLPLGLPSERQGTKYLSHHLCALAGSWIKK